MSELTCNYEQANTDLAIIERRIFELNCGIRVNEMKIASDIAYVKTNKLYEEGNFNTIYEWAEERELFDKLINVLNCYECDVEKVVFYLKMTGLLIGQSWRMI